MTVDVDRLFEETRELLDDGREDEACALLREAKKEEPHNLLLLQLSAQFSDAIGDFEQADSDWAAVIELEPTDAYFWRRRGELSKDWGKFDNALEYLTKSISLDKTSRAVVARGHVYLGKGEMLSAMKDADEALDMDPSDPAAHFLKANLMLRQGRYHEALSESELYRALCESPSARVIFLRADCYNGLRQYAEALDEVNVAVEIEYELADAYTRRSMYNYQLRDWESVVDDASKALSLNPTAQDQLICLQNRGAAFMYLNRYDEALDDLSLAIELDPDDFVPYFDRAKIYELTGFEEAALADLNKGIELCPCDTHFEERDEFLKSCPQLQEAQT
jgi:tetratricopeptide (TPR) repeat protein